MAWFADLSPCTYFREPADLKLRAVGWLSEDEPFPIGPVEPSVIARLRQLLETPFSPWMYLGYHRCELCTVTRAEGSLERIRRGRFPDWSIDVPTTVFRYKCEGTRNLFVPGEREVYGCPELILHYIGAHGYAPPEEFCRAVLRCPRIPSIRYFHRLFGVGGDEWVIVIERLFAPDPLIAERLRQLGRKPPRLRWNRPIRMGLRAARLWRSPFHRRLRALFDRDAHPSR